MSPWARSLGKMLALWLVPALYRFYLWFVYQTSKEVRTDLPTLWNMSARGKNVIGAVWHQDVVLAPFIGRGRNVVTMVSHSDLGNVLSKIMDRCNFIPVRGGSGGGGKEALRGIIDYMNTHPGTVCGIAVDGSRGPARKVQIGALLMARATGAPIYPTRLWAKRKLFAPTWDKTSIPLPFNRLIFVLGEPIKVPRDADRAALERLRLELESRLEKLSERADTLLVEGSTNLKTASAGNKDDQFPLLHLPPF